MRRFFLRRRRSPVAEVARESLATALREAAGCWVAVDRATNRIVEAAKTPYELSALIRQRGIRNVTVVRAPDPSEPELVGLG
jgi:hypothetical protein